LRPPASASSGIRPCSSLGDVHATNYGGGVRFNLLPPSANLPTTYGFVEGSYRTTNLRGYSCERIFAGLLLQY
jgi:hypothetical protein